MRYIHLPSGAPIPVLGMGTWRLGESGSNGTDIIAALKLGIDLGMNLIDTAEMYADGGAEELVGKAIAGCRSEVFLVSKVLPHRAGRKEIAAACEQSLKRLSTDYLDLYLLHWRGDAPLAETIAGFGGLLRAGKIRHFGVSNLDRDELEECRQAAEGHALATNQVLYNLARRGIEWNLLPWCRSHGMPVMAYSPFDQGGLLSRRALRQIAKRRGVPPAQIALAWLLHQDGVVAIPKAARVKHIRENRAALELALTAREIAYLDDAFPRPPQNTPLEML